MPSYIVITDAETDPEAPLTSELAKKWRDNPLAIAEGAVGAPRINSIGAMDHQGAAGSIGTYVFAKRSTAADVSFGGTVAGSDLVPTSATTVMPTGVTGAAATFNSGSALSGTWRCMGTYDHAAAFGSGGSMNGATLWLRIS